jgi:hypothetical protein
MGPKVQAGQAGQGEKRKTVGGLTMVVLVRLQRCRPNRLGVAGVWLRAETKMGWRFLILDYLGHIQFVAVDYSRECSRCRVDQGYVLAFFFSSSSWIGSQGEREFGLRETECCYSSEIVV